MNYNVNNTKQVYMNERDLFKQEKLLQKIFSSWNRNELLNFAFQLADMWGQKLRMKPAQPQA